MADRGPLKKNPGVVVRKNPHRIGDGLVDRVAALAGLPEAVARALVAEVLTDVQSDLQLAAGRLGDASEDLGLVARTLVLRIEHVKDRVLRRRPQ